MGPSARKILEDAMALPPEARAAIAHALLASLEAERDPSIDQAWTAEIARRAERFRSGESKGIPAEEVKARIVDRMR